jgi:plastocyanin
LSACKTVLKPAEGGVRTGKVDVPRVEIRRREQIACQRILVENALMKNATMSLMRFLTAGSLLASLGSVLAADYSVQVWDFYYYPSSLTVASGDSVTWINYSYYYTHTATSGDPDNGGDGLWDSGDVGSSATFALNSAGTSHLGAGTYPYFCVYHGSIYGMTGTLTITNPPAPPSIAITNPVAAAKLRAPANMALQAAASGSVTNVQFFSGASSLGSLASPPFNFTLSNAPAGNYSFTAKAVDNQGLAATSAVVNVFVLTNATLTSPVRLTNGQFQFTILGIAGQTYATEASTNLTAWSAISTNVAPSNSFNVVDPAATNIGQRFYRTRQTLF